MKESTRWRFTRVKRAIAHPRRTLGLLTTKSGWRRLSYAVRPPAHGDWIRRSGGLAARDYGRYDDYVIHQKSKLEMLDLSQYEVEFRAGLRERILARSFAGQAVLCLAARLGTEVKAFHDVGAFAVGIDLQPGPNSSTVLTGDFQSLVFPNACVDAVYCNSFDHAFDLSKTLAEIHRVLKSGGVLLVDAQLGTDEAASFDDWAATAWTEVDQLVEVIELAGFRLKERNAIDIPWPGQELHFELV